MHTAEISQQLEEVGTEMSAYNRTTFYKLTIRCRSTSLDIVKSVDGNYGFEACTRLFQ